MLGIVLGTAFGCFLTNAAIISAASRKVGRGEPAALRGDGVERGGGRGVDRISPRRTGGHAHGRRCRGLVAIAHAVDLLRAGQADALVTGGMDAADVALERFVAAGGLPAATPIGEGAAMLVLERADAARARGASALARIVDTRVGFGACPDATRASHTGFAAAPVFELLARLERLAAGAVTTVAEWCPSGHDGAVVMQRLP
jgi:3-oxoacyl-[acyl-carrier-protein] synthase II